MLSLQALKYLKEREGGGLVHDFKGHSRDILKEYKRIFKSGNDNVPDDHRYNLCEFDIMAGGITPKAQPIDAFRGKVFKGLYRCYYYKYML